MCEANIVAVTDSGAGVLGLLGVFGVFSILMYFLPTFVAGLRHHHNGGAIFLLNLLLGWTLLGWVLALVWSVTATHRQLQQVQQPPQPANVGRRNPAYRLNVGQQKPLLEAQTQTTSDSRLNEQSQRDNKSLQISSQQTAANTEGIDWFKTSLIGSCAAAVVLPLMLIYSCTRSHSPNAYTQVTPTPAATAAVQPTPISTPKPVQAKQAPTPYVTPTPYENPVTFPSPAASISETAQSKVVFESTPVNPSSLIHAEDWLNEVYTKIRDKLTGQGKQKLKKDELAWIAYKDSLPAALRLSAISNRISTLEREYGGKSLLERNPPDSEIKAKLLGYWRSPRHDYLLKSDGTMYICPTREGSKDKWDVKAGQFYQDGEPFKIVTFNDLEFAYQDLRDDQVIFTLLRTTETEAEGRK